MNKDACFLVALAVFLLLFSVLAAVVAFIPLPTVYTGCAAIAMFALSAAYMGPKKYDISERKRPNFDCYMIFLLQTTGFTLTIPLLLQLNNVAFLNGLVPYFNWLLPIVIVIYIFMTATSYEDWQTSPWHDEGGDFL